MDKVVNRILALFEWIRAALPKRGPAENGWETAVDQVVADLQNLNRSTERDFLAVGEKLIEFRSETREIASEIGALNDLIAGQRGRQTSAALSAMLETFRAMDARIQQGSQALAAVRDLSRRVRQAFSGLHDTVRVFRTLCTLTRIETSRLGGDSQGFSNLADEVAPLSESIQSTGGRVVELAARLDRSVEAAVASVSGACERQLRALPALISSVADSLGSLADRQGRARETSVREAARNAETCAAIDDLVAAIQFHDITRQQIEHVAQALGGLRAGGQSRGGAAAQARAALSLQSSQLASAERAFMRAVGGIERDLESIRSRAREMADDSQALLGITEDDQHSFFQQMEAALSAILEGVGSGAAAEQELQSTAAGLLGTISQMRGSVAEIRGIEIQIQRMAINATIRAAHIGSAGAALDVISGVMQDLVAKSRRNTEDVAGALEAMGDRARGVADAGGPGDSDPAGGMRAALLELHSSSEASFSRVLRIAELSARLAERIGALRGGFSAGRTLAEVVDRARSELERIGAQATPEPVEEQAAGAAGGLDDFARRYTMQTEREVHERVAAGVAAGQPEPDADQTPESGSPDDLGDNVELF